MYEFAHFDPLDTPHSVSEIDSFRARMYLGLAVAAIVVGLPGPYAVGRSQTKLVRAGVRTTGRICGVANGNFNGIRKVVVEYTVAGERFENAATRDANLNDQIGGKVDVYVDVSNPIKVYVDWKMRRQPFSQNT